MNRDRHTGRFAHDEQFDRLCTCGHRLGEHTAAVVDGRRDCLADGCTCERFKLKKS